MLVTLRGQMVNLATCRLCRVGDSGQASLFKTLNLGLLYFDFCFTLLLTAVHGIIYSRRKPHLRYVSVQ